MKFTKINDAEYGRIYKLGDYFIAYENFYKHYEIYKKTDIAYIDKRIDFAETLQGAKKIIINLIKKETL